MWASPEVWVVSTSGKQANGALTGSPFFASATRSTASFGKGRTTSADHASQVFVSPLASVSKSLRKNTA
jgi:hypothetical protein